MGKGTELKRSYNNLHIRLVKDDDWKPPALEVTVADQITALTVHAPVANIKHGVSLMQDDNWLNALAERLRSLPEVGKIIPTAPDDNLYIPFTHETFVGIENDQILVK